MPQITYHEPTLPHLLTLISFLALLGLFRQVFNKLLGAGLLGEIAVGVIYGPVAKILPYEWETTLLAIGYVGLVLIVFEGGLHLHLRHFLPTLPLSLLSALLGILLPLSLTFALFSSSPFSLPPLQAFTVGSALASTSLGTTFYVLRSSGEGLGETKVGLVLQGAALIDDVVALVLLSVLRSLGEEGGGGGEGKEGLGWTIGRPVLASVGLAIVGPALAVWVVGPGFRKCGVEKWLRRERVGKSVRDTTLLGIGVTVLSGYLAASYYAGTTVLLGAFLAGLTLNVMPSSSAAAIQSATKLGEEETSDAVEVLDFKKTYAEYIEVVQNYILVPLFFSSIGFTIPFLSLWSGRIIWRGIVYSILMTLGKVLVGIVVLVVDSFAHPVDSAGSTLTENELNGLDLATKDFQEHQRRNKVQKRARKLQQLKTESLPAAGFLGIALVARGEIGILVLQVAYGNGGSRILGTEAYLLGIWATALCTIVGPVGFSWLARKYGSRIRNGRWGVVALE